MMSQLTKSKPKRGATFRTGVQDSGAQQALRFLQKEYGGDASRFFRDRQRKTRTERHGSFAVVTLREVKELLARR